MEDEVLIRISKLRVRVGVFLEVDLGLCPLGRLEEMLPIREDHRVHKAHGAALGIEPGLLLASEHGLPFGHAPFRAKKAGAPDGQHATRMVQRIG